MRLNVWDYPCDECTRAIIEPFFDKWQSNRGRKKGSKSKSGSKKTGSIPRPVSELMQFVVLGIKAKDITAYGGLQLLKADCIKMVNNKLK